jgi:CheY-like chemotaxis protein
MATRRVLVFDDDSAFIDLLRRSLAGYRLEIRSVAPGPDNIQALKVLAPELVLISADLPGNAGYGLCSAIRKALGSGIFIVLTTADLSPHDFSLHGKQRLHADLYLDKRGLSDQILVDKLDKLIGLGPRIGPMPPGAENGQEQSAGAENAAEFPGACLTEEYEAEIAFDQDDFTDSDEIPGSFGQTMEDGENPDFEDDLNHRLTEQAAEIFRLRRQLEDALRDGRSSPFSTDFLKLREVIAQKDWEISRLKEQLQARRREILAVKNRTKALEKEKVDFLAELERALKREEDLARLVQDKQGEIAGLQALHKDLEHKRSQEANRAAELLNIEQLAHRQTREEFEALIARLQDQHVQTMKQAEQEKQAAVAAAHQQSAEKLARTDQSREEALGAVKNEYRAILSDKDAEITALKQLTTKGQAQLELGQEVESWIARLQDQHTQAIKKAEQEKNKALESVQKQIDEKLAQSEKIQQRTLEALKSEHKEQIDRILSKKEAEIAFLSQAASKEHEHAHQQVARQFEERIAKLQEQHAQAMQQAEKEKYQALESTHKQFEETLAETQKDHQRVLDTLKIKHAEQINQVKSEKNNAAAALERESAEGVQRALAHTRQKFKEKITQLINRHEEALKQARQEKQTAIESIQRQAKEELAKAQKDHQEAIEALQMKHSGQDARRPSEKKTEEAPAQQDAEQKQSRPIFARVQYQPINKGSNK